MTESYLDGGAVADHLNNVTFGSEDTDISTLAREIGGFEGEPVMWGQINDQMNDAETAEAIMKEFGGAVILIRDENGKIDFLAVLRDVSGVTREGKILRFHARSERNLLLVRYERGWEVKEERFTDFRDPALEFDCEKGEFGPLRYDDSSSQPMRDCFVVDAAFYKRSN